MPKIVTNKTSMQLTAENQDLRARLDEAEETLRAIRSGEVDALVVSGEDGNQIFTLKGADSSYRMLIERMNEGALTMTGDGLILYANSSFAEMLKVPLERVIGSVIDTWMTKDSQRTLRTLIQKNMEGKRREELALTASDGTQLTIYLSVSSMTSDELLNTFCLVATDVTERKQASVVLAQSEQAYRTLFENIPIGLYRTSADGLIKDANPAMVKMFGYQDRESILEKNIVSFYVEPLDNEKFKQAMENNHDLSNFEAEYRRRDGTTLWTEDHTHAVRNKSDDIIFYEGSLVDITARRQAEEKSREDEERLRQVWEATSDAMALSDTNGIVLSANPAYYDLYGYTPDQVIGKSFDMIFSKEIAKQVGEQYRKIFDSDVIPPAFESGVQRADGSERIVEARASFLSTDGQHKLMLSTIRDITERKQAEEATIQYTVELERRVQERTIELTHANRAKDEFLAMMSHELRTPLNSILGFSESLLEQKRGPINEKQEQYIGLIHSSGRHLLDLINDILQVAKIDAGKLDIHPDLISVKGVCESSMNFVKESATKKSISLEVFNEETISNVHADPQRLKQILINLLNNAVKFTPNNGSVSLKVQTNAEKDRIQFLVTDTGIGIAQEDLKKLFTPFTQVDSDLTRQYEGTGLGLVLVYKLTELHGGSVEVESAPGKGSCFIVTLPWSEEENQDQTKDSNPPVRMKVADESASVSGDHGLVLLAEDNESNILTIQEYLMDHGYEVVIARNGLEAVMKAEEFSPKVILMDIQMPKMDGLEATRRLRAMPKFASVPIIAITALAMPGDRELCLEAGANEYLSKPVSLKNLVITIQKMEQLSATLPHEL